jgi:ABC-type multidrug transport system ATPase subunit
VRGLAKSFNGFKAVDGVDLTVKKGETYGFLGPNGAGKTTTIKMILGLVAPDAGSVRIGGRDLSHEPHEIKRRLGYLPERVAMYPNLTALQTLRFYAKLKGAPREGLEELLASVGMKEFADKRVSTFSKGMVQLVGFAQALIGSPEVLILDEPTTGLDPNWMRAVKDHIKTANQAGTTVFFSSHILTEVEELASRVSILNRGKVVAEDAVAALRGRTKAKPRLHMVIHFRKEEAAALARAVPGVDDVSVGEEVVVTSDDTARGQAIAAIVGAGIPIAGMRTVDPSLESVFLEYTESSRGAVR